MNLERVAQSLDYTCGAACFESMFRFLRGYSKGEMFFAEKLGTLSLGYTPPERIYKLAVELGFNAQFKTEASLTDLSQALNKGTVVFVTWWFDDAGHYSLVKKIAESNIILMDPWQARSDQDAEYSTVEFENLWTIRGRVMIAIC